ncbi:hypothetical protein MMC28_005985 [Mycoblastus sanguinarius]|nr:hypothetical protein [Mycoblastus sanguinarius]
MSGTNPSQPTNPRDDYDNAMTAALLAMKQMEKALNEMTKGYNNLHNHYDEINLQLREMRAAQGGRKVEHAKITEAISKLCGLDVAESAGTISGYMHSNDTFEELEEAQENFFLAQDRATEEKEALFKELGQDSHGV